MYMLCKYMYSKTHAVTFNIKYCSVFALFFHAAMWSEMHKSNQKNQKKKQKNTVTWSVLGSWWDHIAWCYV